MTSAQRTPGELFIWTNVDPTYEDDFNQWYDREHMEERAAIPGFCWARRYKNPQNERRYLALYRTDDISVFHSPTYQQAFQHQTAWSLSNFSRMQNSQRRVMKVQPLAGFGTGAAIALITLGDQATAEQVSRIAEQIQKQMDGVLALRLLTPDTELSTPLPSEDTSNRILEPVLIIDTTTEPVAAAASRWIIEEFKLDGTCATTFSLLWDLRSRDLQPR
ncbi:hypothetical protein ACLPHM_11965 [Paenalcaligenes sp. Me131]|uniref:hypothetical protein n=1 Tax=Paenalcaligenes sp. Me131 TaxID=3392636 RepID=UPI003D27FABD